MITAYDTQKVGGEMITALVTQEIQRQKTAREAALEQEIKALQMQLELRQRRDNAIYTRFIEDADRYYFTAENHTIVGDVWWALVGYVVLAFCALFDAVGV